MSEKHSLEVREVALEVLREHEQVEPEHLSRILEEIRREGRLRHPILVDKRSGVILDGHHRFRAYKELGFETIPCVLVDYQSDIISVRPRRPDIPVSKDEVIRRALTGKLFPPKTTQHVLHCPIAEVAWEPEWGYNKSVPKRG
ncbi:MAG: ParB N-terminal domain-containing protein [Candidatus Bipolaricaulota bacterium]|nr:ParB N-terminal domain-containing protein [Candidatus Bipolaricaulota bacterium]